MVHGYHIRSNSARMLATAQMRDDLAEHVAEGGSLAGYARATGMTERGVSKAWRAICDGLEEQAV